MGGYLQKWRDRESRGHWGREVELGHSYSESLRKGQFLPNGLPHFRDTHAPLSRLLVIPVTHTLLSNSCSGEFQVPTGILQDAQMDLELCVGTAATKPPIHHHKGSNPSPPK